MLLASNAPESWPRVPLLPPGPAPPGARRLQAAAALATALRKTGEGPRLAGLRRHLLLEGGILEATLLVEASGEEVAVLVYEAADEAAASHYEAAKRACRASGRPDPVYYAPEPLPPAPAGELPRFGPEHVAPLEGASPPVGRYAAWWPTASEPAFDGSRVQDALDRTVRALDGLASYAVAPYVARLGLVPPDAERVRLQGDPLVAPACGPGDVPLLFTASRERGPGWRLPARNDLVEYRDRLWTQFAEGAERLREAADAEGWARDPQEENGAPAWWEGARESVGRKPFGVSVVSRDEP